MGMSASAARRLTALLDGMGVEGLWRAGFPIDWRLGLPTGPLNSTPGIVSVGHTHCAAFAAAVAERMDLYLLRPPEYEQAGLANAQALWLNGVGQGRFTAREAGWRKIGRLSDNGASEKALAHASQGRLVLAICSPPPEATRRQGLATPAHVVIVRPGQKSEARLRDHGPDVIQAGRVNHARIPLRLAFSPYPLAWAMGKIEYFWAGAKE